MITVRMALLSADDTATLIRASDFAARARAGLDACCTHLEGSDADGGWHRLTCIGVSSPSAGTR